MCYNRTQHVIAISLEGNKGMRGAIGDTLGRLPYLLGTEMGSNKLIANIAMLLNSFRPFFIRLNFASNEIYGELPNDIATKWRDLGKLQLSGNKDLHGSLPHNIEEMKNLQVLSIGQTGITGRIPGNIARLSKLYFLDLESLSMTGDLKYFKGLYTLEYMHLMSNKIDGAIPHDFGDWFPKLLQLNLEGNLLRGPVPKSIGNMRNLTLLKLSDNRRLTGQIPLSFTNLSDLAMLDLSYTQISGFEKGLALRSSKLSAFVVKGNAQFSMNISTLVLSALWYSRNSLVQLDVKDCNIYGEFDKIFGTTLQADDITKFSKLALLNLGGNKRLSGTIPLAISDVHSIMYFDVSHTNLSSQLPIEYLSVLRFLQTIDIRGNPAMKGDLDEAYITLDYTLMSTEEASGNFACPAIRLKHSNSIIKTDSSYYDRRYCLCNQGYYGQGGYCQKCMIGGRCIGSEGMTRKLVNITSVSSIFGDYILSGMKLRRGYWPYPSHNNVCELIKCAWTQPGRELCNPLGTVSCNLNKKNASYVTICKPKQNICAHGSYKELCSRCKNGYFKQGLHCYACPKSETEKNQIVTIFIDICMIIFIGGGFACYAYNLYDQNSLCQKLLAVVLTILEAVTVFILAALRIIPSWLAQINIIIMLLTIGGFGIGKSFLTF